MVGRKVNKHGFLADLYTASQSDWACRGGRLRGHSDVPVSCWRNISTSAPPGRRSNRRIRRSAPILTISGSEPYREWDRFLRSRFWRKPGIRRFPHHRQFLKFCGFDLSTQQSGQFRGTSRLSKRGNAAPLCLWMAAMGGPDAAKYVSGKICAVYQIPILQNPDRKRKALRRRRQGGARRAWVNQDGNRLSARILRHSSQWSTPFARAVEAGTDLVDNARSFHWGCLLCGVR